MSESGFSVLCSPAGLVTATFGTTMLEVGSALVLAAAQDSRERLLQILADARQSEQHSILSTAEGTTVEIHCASDGVQTLVIAGKDPGEVRRRCGELFDDPVAGSLARRIIDTAAPDELTLDLWSEPRTPQQRAGDGAAKAGEEQCRAAMAQRAEKPASWNGGT